jgi:anti-sigma B factor antagonist
MGITHKSIQVRILRKREKGWWRFVKSQSFDISVARNEHSKIVRLSGEIDFAASLDLDPVLSDIIDEDDCELMLDMANVTFIDSEGIRLLLKIFSKMRQADRQVRVVNCSGQVMRVMKLAGISEILNLEIEKAPPFIKTGQERVQPLNWLPRQR